MGTLEHIHQCLYVYNESLITFSKVYNILGYRLTISSQNQQHWKQDHQFDNFLMTGGTVSCRNDNLRRHQWWKSCQIENIVFPVNEHSNHCTHNWNNSSVSG